MAYDEKLAERIRGRLAGPGMEEKPMMGGLTFMYNGKMCLGVIKNEMMCRIDPAIHDAAVKRPGCRVMDFTSKPMKGYVLVNDTGMRSQQDFEYWIGLALAYNPKAKASKKKKQAGKRPGPPAKKS